MATPLAPGFKYSGATQHRLSYSEVKHLAESFGLPGDAMAQIAKGESGLYADIQQHDPGDGMVGYGLLQMTPNAWGKGSAAYKEMQRLGGVRAMRDPVKNMAMARFLYKSAGNKLTPWYGTRYLTNRAGEGTLGPVTSHPDLVSGAPAGMPQGTTGATYRTIPGKSLLPERQAAAASFLGQRGSSANQNLAFAQQVSGLQDQPGQRVRIPGAQGSGAGGAPGAGNLPSPGGFAKSHSPLLELIYNGADPFAVKNGQKVSPDIYAAVWDQHKNHVHVAAGPKTVVELGRLAQKMGLNVGENPHFGGVAPVHVQGSYHYKGEAIDVSGDPRKMESFAKEVSKLYRL